MGFLRLLSIIGYSVAGLSPSRPAAIPLTDGVKLATLHRSVAGNYLLFSVLYFCLWVAATPRHLRTGLGEVVHYRCGYRTSREAHILLFVNLPWVAIS